MENFKVMLAKPFEEKRVSFPTYISPKLDGVRAFYYKGEFYTRNRKQLKGLSHLKEVLAEHERRLDQSLWLDGELIVLIKSIVIFDFINDYSEKLILCVCSIPPQPSAVEVVKHFNACSLNLIFKGV